MVYFSSELHQITYRIKYVFLPGTGDRSDVKKIVLVNYYLYNLQAKIFYLLNDIHFLDLQVAENLNYSKWTSMFQCCLSSDMIQTDYIGPSALQLLMNKHLESH